MAITPNAAESRPPQTLPSPSFSRAPLPPMNTATTENPNLLRPPHSSQMSLAAPTSKTKSTFIRATSPVPLTGAATLAELRKANQHTTAEDARARRTSPNPDVQSIRRLMGADSAMSKAPPPTSSTARGPMQQQQGLGPTHPVSGVHAGVVQASRALSNLASGASSTAAGMTAASSATAGMTAASSATAGMMATASNAEATTHGQDLVASPMDENGTPSPDNRNLAPVTSDPDGAKAFSYPGPPPRDDTQSDGPSRGMSLPGYGQTSPKSPASNNKRHKCPYCSTDFTRHHNLKSHLLTHSQEKPYVCQTCQARFRRLHDLKRHSKLHTGERPHTCRICGRRFARGDALARHSKAPGGCAGQRSSFGGGGDDDYGPDGGPMDGLEYGGDDDHETSSPDHGRRGSEPSRKRTHLETAHDAHRDVYRQHSSTYPPPPQRPHASSAGSMGPPPVVLSGSHSHVHATSTTTSPRETPGQPSPTAGSSSITSAYHPTSGQVFAHQGAMMESPKPLSPGQQGPPSQSGGAPRLGAGAEASLGSTRHRSPSHTTQFQQTHFGRGIGSSIRGGSPLQQQQQLPPPLHPQPVLPPLGSHAAPPPPPTRSGLPASVLAGSTGAGPGPSMLQHQHIPPPPPPPSSSSSSAAPHNMPPASTNDSSLSSSYGRSSGSSMRDVLGGSNGGNGGGGSGGNGGGNGGNGAAVPADPSSHDVWAYVRALELRFVRMQDEYELRLSRLQEEVIALKGLLPHPPHPHPHPHPVVSGASGASGASAGAGPAGPAPGPPYGHGEMGGGPGMGARY